MNIEVYILSLFIFRFQKKDKRKGGENYLQDGQS